MKVLRLVSWNVADNAGMDGGFPEEAMDKLLGIDVAGAKVGYFKDCMKLRHSELSHSPVQTLARLPYSFICLSVTPICSVAGPSSPGLHDTVCL